MIDTFKVGHLSVLYGVFSEAKMHPRRNVILQQD